MQQAVDAAEIDERAVVGQVLDDALDDHALLEVFQHGLALGAELGLDHGAARNHHVVAALVELDDLEFEFLAFQETRVTYRPYIHQRARQEGADVLDIDGKAALDLAADDALDDILVFVGLLQPAPDLVAFCLFAGQPGFTKAVLYRLQRYLDLVADLDFQFTGGVLEFIDRYYAFRFQAGVNDHVIRLNINYCSNYHCAPVHLLVNEALFKHFSKTLSHGKIHPGTACADHVNSHCIRRCSRSG